MKASGSSAALLLACQYSFRDDVEVPIEAASDASDYGTRLHYWCEHYANGLLAPAFASFQVESDMVADFQVCKDWIYDNFSKQWQPEVQVAFDWITGKARFLSPKEKARDYSDKTATELPGTVDILAPTVGSVTVYDWTTARNYGYKWPQLKLYAMMAARILGKDTARAVMLQVRDGVLTEDSRDYTKDDLDAMASEIQFAAATVKGSTPTPGGHCTELYCKLRHTCPAVVEMRQQALMVARPGKLMAQHRLSLEIAGPEHAGWMVGAVDSVVSALTEIKKRLNAYADSIGGIPMGNGTVYAQSTTTREAVDFSKGVPKVLVNEFADEAIKTSITMSWTDLDKVVGKPKAKEIRESLRKSGELKVSSYPTYSVKKVKS